MSNNKILQEAKKKIDEWNKRRVEAEKRGIERFWKLKELFKPSNK